MCWVWNISVKWAKQAPVQSEEWELYGLYLWPEHLTDRYNRMKLPEPSERQILHIFPWKHNDRSTQPNREIVFPVPKLELQLVLYTKRISGKDYIRWKTKEKGYNAYVIHFHHVWVMSYIKACTDEHIEEAANLNISYYGMWWNTNL